MPMLDSDRLDSLHHVAIPVADLKRAIQWYATSFRCEVIFEEETQAILQFSNVRIVLVMPSQQPPHVAFPKVDAHRFGELMVRKDGTISTYLSDPTGNVVELIAPRWVPTFDENAERLAESEDSSRKRKEDEFGVR